jgi:hypothetical protein
VSAVVPASAVIARRSQVINARRVLPHRLIGFS